MNIQMAHRWTVVCKTCGLDLGEALDEDEAVSWAHEHVAERSLDNPRYRPNADHVLMITARVVVGVNP